MGTKVSGLGVESDFGKHVSQGAPHAHRTAKFFHIKGAFINTSTGAPDAGKPIKLDSSGKIDSSMYGTLPSHTHVKVDITDTPWAWADVLKTGSNLTDLATRNHAGLQNITDSQHHNKLHSIVGVQHSASGLTIGHFLRAISPTTFTFQAIQTGDLPSPSHAFTNLLSNSGFEVWNEDDGNRGLGALTYDNLAVSTFQVGETVTGQTSGAVGKVQKNVGSVLTLGACAGRFQDDEQIVGGTSGATADVNMPNSAAGVDLVQNGDFSVDTDPPPGWTAGNGSTLTTEGAGQIGNCMMISNGQDDNGRAVQPDITLEEGKIYKFICYFKKGTGTGGDIKLYDVDHSVYIKEWVATDATWTIYTFTFEATNFTTLRITLRNNEAVTGKTAYFDEISCYEITLCYTRADNLAFDGGWKKDSGVDIYREHSGSNTKDGSFYALKFVPTSANMRIIWNWDLRTKLDFRAAFEGRTLTRGAWVKAFAANHARLEYYDSGGGYSFSSYHTGGGAWEWLELTVAVSATITELYLFVLRGTLAGNVDGTTIVYISQPMLLFGSSIGEGNYQPKQYDPEIIENPYVLTNLFPNSGFGVWSQSDAEEGLGTLTYDNLAVSTFQVGEGIIGQTSGAWAVVISDISFVLTLGACDGRFHDNEQIVGQASGATADVNMPDSTVGVDLVQNGDFSVDTDPPPGWTVRLGTITTEGGGQVGNCMKNASLAGSAPWAKQTITVEIGKIYKIGGYFKHVDSTGGACVFVGTTNEGAEYGAPVDDDMTTAWTAWSLTFEATTISCYLSLRSNATGVGQYDLFDEIYCYEITPNITGVNAGAPDGWAKNIYVDVYREHDGNNTKDGSFYALKIVNGATPARGIYWQFTQEEIYKPYISRTITIGAWVKTNAANNANLKILEGGVGGSTSPYHTGGGDYEWLEVTRTISASMMYIGIEIRGALAGNVDGSTIIYLSQPMLVFGSSIGEGNYQPKQGEIIWLEQKILSNKFHAIYSLGNSGWSDLNIEGDTDAMLPKGIRSISVAVGVRDSGCAAIPTFFQFRRNSNQGFQFINTLTGIANDEVRYLGGRQACDENGDVQYNVVASGGDTFDIPIFHYTAVQLN